MNTLCCKPDSLTNRILVVDDIVDNSFLLQIFLESEGYWVDTATNGYDALTKITENPPGLVLLDVMMPDMNGCEVMQKIRQNKYLPYIPVVFVTGSDCSTFFHGISMQADGLIHKPVDFALLLNQVRSLLLQETNQPENVHQEDC